MNSASGGETCAATCACAGWVRRLGKSFLGLAPVAGAVIWTHALAQGRARDRLDLDWLAAPECLIVSGGSARPRRPRVVWPPDSGAGEVAN
jgi:hypothetical protein